MNVTEIGGRVGNAPQGPEYDGRVRDSRDQSRNSAVPESHFTELEAVDTILVAPESLRRDFFSKVYELAEIDVPEDVRQGFEEIVTQYLNQVYTDYAERVQADITTHLSDGENDPFFHLDTVDRQIATRFQSESNLPLFQDQTYGDSQFDVAAHLVAEVTRHLAYDRSLYNLRRLTRSDLPALMTVLLPTADTILIEGNTPQQDEQTRDFLHVVDVVTVGTTFNQGDPNQAMATVINFIDECRDFSAARQVAQEAAATGGTTDLDLSDPSLDAGAILNLMTADQQGELISHILEQADTAHYPLIVDIALYSGKISKRRALNLLAPYSSDPAVAVLASEIEARSQIAQDTIASFSEEIISRVDQPDLQNPVNELSPMLYAVAMTYTSLAALTNAVIAIGSANGAALVYSMGFAAAATVTFDKLTGRSAGSTLAGMAGRVFTSRAEIAAVDREVLKEALANQVFGDMTDDQVRALGNPDVISQLKLAAELDDEEDLSRESVATRLQNRLGDPGLEDPAAYSTDVETLISYLDGLPDDTANERLFLLCHSYLQLGISDMNQLNSQVLEPHGLQILTSTV